MVDDVFEEEVSEEEQDDLDDAQAAGSNNPLAILFYPDKNVWYEARRLVADANVRVENLATIVVQDPVIVIELLRVSNAMYFSGGRSAITSPKTAIVRLGSDIVLETLEKLSERPRPDEDEIIRWIEVHRSRCKRTGIVARLIAEAIARNLCDDCQAAGCLFSIGEMLAVAHLGQVYLEIAEEHSRSGVNYRLTQNHNFDTDKMGLNYLRRYGIPEALLFALDREARSRAPERAVMRPLCMSASELVDAFDANRWEKLAPGKQLAPKSAIRTLQMNDSQYLKIYERASEYLFSARMIEEKRKREQDDDPGINFDSGLGDDGVSFESEIQHIIQDQDATEITIDPSIDDSIHFFDPEPEETVIEEEEEPVAIEELFKINTDHGLEKTMPRVDKETKIVAPPQLRTSKGNEFVSSVADLLEDADNSEDLLANLLQRLTDGPFEKSALIVVSHDRLHAIVVASRGPIGNGQKIELKDPLSPLAQCFSKVQSFASRANEASPFGCKSFALAPIDADHETPVALYADCGNDKALSFEARRIFRTVVHILNQKLPSIPGGVLVELDV